MAQAYVFHVQAFPQHCPEQKGHDIMFSHFIFFSFLRILWVFWVLSFLSTCVYFLGVIAGFSCLIWEDKVTTVWSSTNASIIKFMATEGQDETPLVLLWFPFGHQFSSSPWILRYNFCATWFVMCTTIVGSVCRERRWWIYCNVANTSLLISPLNQSQMGSMHHFRSIHIKSAFTINGTSYSRRQVLQCSTW